MCTLLVPCPYKTIQMPGSSKKPSVLISGASTGIGEATAQLLAEKGWTVFAGVRKQTDAEKLQSHNANIKSVILDVTKPEQVTEAVEQVRVAVGEDGLDALVNNAGLAFTGPIEFMSMEDVQRQFDINFFGTIRLTQAAMPLIRLGKPGRVVNVSSIGSQQVAPFVGIYDSTKAAIEAVSAALRIEVARWGIHVVVVKPGPVQTKFETAVMSIHSDYMKRFTPGTPCYEFFGQDLENIPKAAEPFKKHMIEPSVVAGRIHQALTDKNPRATYYDTWGSYLTVQLINWLPTSWYDRIMASIFFAKDKK